MDAALARDLVLLSAGAGLGLLSSFAGIIFEHWLRGRGKLHIHFSTWHGTARKASTNSGHPVVPLQEADYAVYYLGAEMTNNKARLKATMLFFEKFASGTATPAVRSSYRVVIH